MKKLIFLLILMSTPVYGSNFFSRLMNRILNSHYGPIPNLSARSLYAVYYGDWNQALVDEIIGAHGNPKYDLVILHPKSNVTRPVIKDLQNGGVRVLGYLSVGEDDTLHSSAFTSGISGPVPGQAAWYYDVDGNGLPDRNGSYGRYVNVSHPSWYEALKNFKNENSKGGVEGWYGYDYILNTLGCDGLFLDTIDTVAPASWGGLYSAQMNDMIDLIAKIRRDLPSDRTLMINRGIFFFRPGHYPEITSKMSDRLRGLISGLMLESFLLSSSAEQQLWGNLLNVEASKPDGFTIVSLDYVDPVLIQSQDIQNMCQTTQGTYGWPSYISTPALDTLYHFVRDDCRIP